MLIQGVRKVPVNNVVNISPACEKDALDIFNLVNEAYFFEKCRRPDVPYYASVDNVLESMSQEAQTFFLLKDQDSILACILSEKDQKNKRVVFHSFALCSSRRGSGLGKQLLDYCEQEARDSLCASAYVYVLSTSEALRAYYCKNGYEYTGKSLVPEDDWLKQTRIECLRNEVFFHEMCKKLE